MPESFIGSELGEFMKLFTTKYLYEYWNELRGKRAAPSRKELDPNVLKDVLPNLFLLDRLGKSEYNFRLAGTKTCNIFGKELRDSNFLDLWSANDRDSFASLLETLTEQGAVIVCGLKGMVAENQMNDEPRPVNFEFLALPLFHTQSGQCTSVIGSFGFDAEVERQHLLPIKDIEMVSLRVIWPIDEQVNAPKIVSGKNSQLQIAIDEAESATSQPDYMARRAQFKLIKGGKS